MNVISFLIILAVVLLVIFYIFMFRGRKSEFTKKFFWITGILSVAYGMVFNGVIDRIFLVFFAFFLVFAKLVMSLMET